MLMKNSLFLISLICTQWADCLALAHCSLSFHCRCNISSPLIAYAQLEWTLTYLLPIPFDYYPVPLPPFQPAMPQLRPSLKKKKGSYSTSTCLQFVLELVAAWGTQILHCSQNVFTSHVRAISDTIICIDGFTNVIQGYNKYDLFCFLPTAFAINSLCSHCVSKSGYIWYRNRAQ